MATTVNYDDKRLTDVENQKTQALSDVEKTYGGMIDKATTFYDKQIDAVDKYGKEQQKLQQQQTDFALEKIQQQKDYAKQDYLKEQSGAYTDWQKQSNQYGANAEAMAAQGLANSGYSESAQVSMYNTYQQRVVAARDVYQRAVLDYDNQMNEARLQNSAALAEIAFNTLKTKLELGLDGFQYQNDLIIQKADKKLALDSEYHNRYMDVLSQINTENALAEEIRQYNQDYALREKEYEEGIRQFNKEIELSQARFAEEKRQFNQLHGGATEFGSKARQALKSGARAVGSAIKKAKDTVKNAANEVSNKADDKALASKYLNELIASGASKDKVANEIAIALREGAISKKEAAQLRSKFTPRGVQY